MIEIPRRPRINEMLSSHLYLNSKFSMSYLNSFMPKTAFFNISKYKNLGCGQGSGGGHRDLRPRINEMLPLHLYLSN